MRTAGAAASLHSTDTRGPLHGLPFPIWQTGEQLAARFSPADEAGHECLPMAAALVVKIPLCRLPKQCALSCMWLPSMFQTVESKAAHLQLKQAGFALVFIFILDFTSQCLDAQVYRMPDRQQPQWSHECPHL